MQTRMEVAENKYVFMATTVLNCEGWERKNEDGEEDDGFADDNPSRTPYLRVWRRIFHSSQKDEWSMVLLLVELLFSIPISNAKVERLFLLMNRVKTDSQATLGEDTLNQGQHRFSSAPCGIRRIQPCAKPSRFTNQIS
ncbi:hypothetical protein OS493_012818 [Desmophyllum pertusum]|uniref:HAT C-terminal dimerisation domain-containing protein n=1 Tax=Desmophyllum pertusum TaxID=174260 RepID=A0A9X0CRR5_9CNID|nr:hypothetical protein OS493_012818 [Desmophyllum pertusum]